SPCPGRQELSQRPNSKAAAGSTVSVCNLRMRARGILKEYRVVGRRLPSTAVPQPPLYEMRIFATDSVTAKSRFWYFVRHLKKLKKMHGEVLQCKIVPPKKALRVKNYGVWLRYNSRSGTHNMYKEYRDMAPAAAITQCYREMGARHRARASSIHILKIKEIASKDCKRPCVTQFHDSKLKFPLPHRVHRKLHAPRFTTVRPKTTF
ncbi:hypothetical protein BOX15_Mlig014446g1, partial [Macrostomum lignano]